MQNVFKSVLCIYIAIQNQVFIIFFPSCNNVSSGQWEYDTLITSWVEENDKIAANTGKE